MTSDVYAISFIASVVFVIAMCLIANAISTTRYWTTDIQTMLVIVVGCVIPVVNILLAIATTFLLLGAIGDRLETKNFLKKTPFYTEK